jgi:hypothetical protein
LGPAQFTSFHRLADILVLAPERMSAGVWGTGGTIMARLELHTHGIEESTDYGSTPDALYQLGLMYCVGRDVDVDLVEAHKWFNLAAMRGNDDAKRYRFEISREMSKVQVSRAQRLAREWIATH